MVWSLAAPPPYGVMVAIRQKGTIPYATRAHHWDVRSAQRSNRFLVMSFIPYKNRCGRSVNGKSVHMSTTKEIIPSLVKRAERAEICRRGSVESVVAGLLRFFLFRCVVVVVAAALLPLLSPLTYCGNEEACKRSWNRGGDDDPNRPLPPASGRGSRTPLPSRTTTGQTADLLLAVAVLLPPVVIGVVLLVNAWT